MGRRVRIVDPPFVPEEFSIPSGLSTGPFLLVRLGLEHNEGDLAAWSSSVEHIHATAGFEGHPWPDEPMTLERNARDLAGHVADWDARAGFTYSVLGVEDRSVIGCVYIYPPRDETSDAWVRSWVRASHAALDADLYRAVDGWLRDAWPFASAEYAARP